MRKLMRNKKGVSPVVSAVIMMLVAMLGMSALFAFFVNYSKDFQMGSGSAVLESITVEDLWFKPNENQVEIWVYNFGKADVTLTDVYVDRDAVQFETLTIAVGDHGKIVLESFPFASEPLHAYMFKIITARGTSFEVAQTW